MDGKLLALNINVSKITRDRLFEGEKGKYLSLDVWLNDEPDQYGHDASVSESLTKEEREAGMKKNYLGNGKKLLGWDSPGEVSGRSPAEAEDDDDGLPF